MPPSLSSTQPSTQSSPPPAPSAPNRASRAHCYAARDKFFACLELHGIIDSIKEKGRAEEVCGREEGELGAECVSSWVTYFKQRRVMEHNKKQTLEKLEREGARFEA